MKPLSRRGWTAIAAAMVLLHAGMTRTAQAQTKVNQGSLIMLDFGRRVAAYMKLHNAARDGIHDPKMTSSAEAIERHQHQLATRIRRLRSAAKQGDIFTAEIAAEFLRLITNTMEGKQASRIQESLKQAEPVRLMTLRVNESYPENIPLQTTPPSLLIDLPELPPGLEYRVSGKSLFVRDVEANLIVDFIRNAIL